MTRTMSSLPILSCCVVVAMLGAACGATTSNPPADGLVGGDVDDLVPDVPGSDESVVPGVSITGLKVDDNPNSTLSKWVSFDTNVMSTATVRIYHKDGAIYQSVGPGADVERSHRIGIIGLRANSAYSLEVIAAVGDVSVTSDRVQFATGGLPPGFPVLHFNTLDVAARQPGFTLFTIWTMTALAQNLAEAIPVLVGIDREGQVVYYREALDPTQGGFFLLLRSGTILYIDQLFARSQIVNGMGDLTATFLASDFDAKFFDHGVESLPDGNWVVLANTADISSSTSSTAAIIEMTDKAELVRQSPLGGVLSAMYGDSELRDVDLDPTDGTFVVLLVDGAVKINRTTGAVIWRMGGPNSDFTFEGDGYFPPRLHGLQVLPNGNLLVYDNGNPILNKAPRAVEIAYTYNPGGVSTMRQAWTWAPQIPIISPDMGNVLRLPNGNTLICQGGNVVDSPAVHIEAHVVEITGENPPRVVMDMAVPGVFDGADMKAMYIIYQVYPFDDIYTLQK